MAATFEGVDFYDVDSLLDEEERMVRNTIREWVQDRVMPVIGEAYVERRFPTEIIPEMGELGMLGANLPEEYGCAGLNNVAYGLIMQELERGDSGIRSFASVQGALVMYPIHSFGSEEQRGTWLPKLATGEAIGCFGLTEPDYGSNPGGMITTAQRIDGGWRLNGAKMWITNGSMADVAVIWAQTGELGDPRGIVRGAHGHAGLQRPGPEGQAFAPGLRHQRDRPRGRRGARGGLHARERGRPPAPPHVPDPGTVRDRLGCGGCGHGLLRRGPTLCRRARHVRRAHRR